MSMLAPQDYRCEVVFNQSCGSQLKRLRLKTLSASGGAAGFACQPGQFVMVDLPEARFMFRRPFSVLQTLNGREFDLYYKVVGEGTRMMAAWEPGLQTRVLGPLGNRFAPPSQPGSALYIGGGIGIAPLFFLGKTTQKPGHCLYGIRTAGELGLHDELKALFGDRLHVSTDDGSAGFHGNVCQLLEARPELAQGAQEAYVCGPTPMMAAVARLLPQLNPAMRVQVSLEEHMPCGTGACTGCVVPRADQLLPSKVCVEGPVFDARCIAWPGESRQPACWEASACP